MVKNILFLGAGGIGMSSLVKYLLAKGYNVFGYDRNYSEMIKTLENKGMIFVKESELSEMSFLGNIHLIVRTSAIKVNSGLLSEANKMKIPVIKRSKLLGEICSLGSQICIAGTHGKTTTTSMTATIFQNANLNPTVFVGGEVVNFNDNFKEGSDDVFVIEADEYDRSFYDLNPRIAAITNIEEDHLDIYQNLEDIKNSFLKFAGKIPFHGSLILWSELPFLEEFKQNLYCKIETFGLNKNSDWYPENISYNGFSVKFDVYYRQKFYTDIRLNAIGNHNILDAVVSIAIAHQYKINTKNIKEGLENFLGVKRRLQKLGEKNNIIFLDDYAHHPSEIYATLDSLKANFQNRIVAVFQPHLFSRTRDFYQEFAEKLSVADFVILTEIYPAREKPIKNVNSKLIADLVKKDVIIAKDKNDLCEKMNKTIKKGDIVVALGAGTISKWIHEFYEKY